MIYQFLFTVLLLFPLLASASTENNFLVLSDIHLNIASAHTMEISPTTSTIKNDLDLATFKKLMIKLHENINTGRIAKPKFVIVLGDLVRHIPSSTENVVATESQVFDTLKINFPDTPIFYTFGNNDSLVVDYGKFRDEKERGPYKSPYDVAKLAAGWQDGFLSTGVMCGQSPKKFPCIITEDTQNGYYSAYLEPGLQLIALNTVLFSPHGRTSRKEALHELQWLETQLKIAKANQEAVLITMHIPPGNNVYDDSTFWLADEQTIFLNLLKTYQQTIIGLLAGHTHNEELKMIKDANHKTIAGVYFTAGLSTSHGNEPSVKTFYFAKNNNQWQLTNYEAFHFSEDNHHLVFNKLYDYKNYYCHSLADNLLACLNDVSVNKMKRYYTTGNINFGGTMSAPDDFVLTMPK